MSQVTPIEAEIIKEADTKTAKWADYNAAYSEFEVLRKGLIRDIMTMEIKHEADFYAQLQQKIENFKRSQKLRNVAKSIITGEILTKTSSKYIEQHVFRIDQSQAQNSQKYQEVNLENLEISDITPTEPLTETKSEDVLVQENKPTEPLTETKSEDVLVQENKPTEPLTETKSEDVLVQERQPFDTIYQKLLEKKSGGKPLSDNQKKKFKKKLRQKYNKGIDLYSLDIKPSQTNEEQL